MPPSQPSLPPVGRALARRLAASVVVCRPEKRTDSLKGGPPFSVLLVRRTSKSSFMPNTYVFPGGQCDEADYRMANEKSILSNAKAIVDLATKTKFPIPALRVCAARELYEEAGVLICPRSAAPPARSAVHKDPAIFAQACDTTQLLAETAEKDGTLTYFTNFLTPDFEVQRQMKKGKYGFDTAFYVHMLRDEDEVIAAAADDAEVHDLKWLSPSAALEQAGRGELRLGQPQWYLLRELAVVKRSEDLVAYVRGRRVLRDFPIRLVPVGMEEVAERDGGSGREGTSTAMTLAAPGDQEHPDFPGSAGMRHRMRFLIAPQPESATAVHKTEVECNFDLSSEEVCREVATRAAQVVSSTPPCVAEVSTTSSKL